MARGTVKWFNADKGYGFIEQESGGPDVFVHITAVQQAGLQTLNDGAAVSFEVETGRNGKPNATDLRLA
ncbi:cold-shock protein [Paracoccus rhizosphaerae]|uniref:Cold-shock protein n=1 Tax=Paracoccus rhizosphaerae TaxID=1133347 RepID=A0ABV6CE15_9RHOB|nr:cold-shock protein [Paracoccus rhizosphaerae]